MEWTLSGRAGPRLDGRGRHAEAGRLSRASTLLWTKDDGTLTDVHVYFDVAAVKALLGAGPRELEGLAPPADTLRPGAGRSRRGPRSRTTRRPCAPRSQRSRTTARARTSTPWPTRSRSTRSIAPSRRRGREEQRAYFKAMHKAIAQLDTTIDKRSSVGPYAIVEYSITGEQLAPDRLGAAAARSRREAARRRGRRGRRTRRSPASGATTTRARWRRRGRDASRTPSRSWARNLCAPQVVAPVVASRRWSVACRREPGEPPVAEQRCVSSACRPWCSSRRRALSDTGKPGPCSPCGSSRCVMTNLYLIRSDRELLRRRLAVEEEGETRGGSQGVLRPPAAPGPRDARRRRARPPVRLVRRSAPGRPRGLRSPCPRGCSSSSWVFRANTYCSSVIEIRAQQTVVSHRPLPPRAPPDVHGRPPRRRARCRWRSVRTSRRSSSCRSSRSSSSASSRRRGSSPPSSPATPRT